MSLQLIQCTNQATSLKTTLMTSVAFLTPADRAKFMLGDALC